MHVSSRNMFPTTRNLQIRVHVYRPRHYCGGWLLSVVLFRWLPIITLTLKIRSKADFKSKSQNIWQQIILFSSTVMQMICAWHNIWNHGCWGKHAYIPDNDYRGICLFHVVWTIFFCNYSYVVHTEYIFTSTEQCTWAIISSKEFKSWVTRISFALLYDITLKAYCLWFCWKILTVHKWFV
jgi:hypothetical protein